MPRFCNSWVVLHCAGSVIHVVMICLEVLQLLSWWTHQRTPLVLTQVDCGLNSQHQDNNRSCLLLDGFFDLDHFCVAVNVSLYLNQGWLKCQRWSRRGSRSWRIRSTDRCSSTLWTRSRSCCLFLYQVCMCIFKRVCMFLFVCVCMLRGGKCRSLSIYQLL